MLIYVNGSLVGSLDNNNPILMRPRENYWLGKSRWSQDYHFKGWIYSLHIWDQLDANEVSVLYNRFVTIPKIGTTYK